MNENRKSLLTLPFVRFAPFMTAGMLAAYFGGSPAGVIIFAAAAAASVYFAKKRSKVLLCALGLLWGTASMGFYIHFRCRPILEYCDQTVRAEIIVKEIAATSGQSEEIIAQAKFGGINTNLRLISGERLEEGYKAAAVIALEPADSNNAAQNFSKGILLSGDILEIESITPQRSYPREIIKALRRSLSQTLEENVSGESGALASAMLFGMDEKLSPALGEMLKIAGAAHYTAVSGAHFAVFAAVLLGMIPEKRRKTKIVLSLLFAPAAVVFFGFSASVLRASVMFFLYSLAPIFLRKSDLLNSLCLTVTMVSIVNPATILDIGFAMSVLGVFGAGAAGTEIAKKLCLLLPDKAVGLSPVVTALSVSLCAVICTSPVSAAIFKGVSLSGVLVSILLMPLMTIAMMFMLLLGITQVPLLSVPIDISMKAAAAIVRFFGGNRGMWLSLDFKGAWIPAAICAALTAAAAFGNMKAFSFSAKGIAVLTLFSILMSIFTIQNRSEIRFVGNYRSSAAVVLDKNEAAVFIAGGGGGLAESISRIMREHGAVKITCLAAFEADYGGALAIKELSELMEIDAVYSNETTRGLLKEIHTEIVPENSKLSVSGFSIASANVSDSKTSADIVLYHGRITKPPENSAGIAVYFSSAEKELPENGYNARRDRDFSVKLDKGQKTISIIS